MTITSLRAPDLTARLHGLPPEEATALLFAAIPGITYREVAARLGEDPAVILRRLTSGLRALRPEPQDRKSRASQSQSSTDRSSDSTSMRSSFPWKRDQNSPGVTLRESIPNP